MNFKFKTFSLLCAGLALGLTACNNDDLLEGTGPKAEGDGVYMHVLAGISLPSSGGTRSATDDTGYESDATPDFETAYDFENEIRTMILVYADKENNYVTHSVVKGITKAPVTGDPNFYDYVVVGEIAHENLAKAYDKDNNGVLANYDPATDDIHVFAICNYTENIENLFKTADSNITKTEWINWFGTVNEQPSKAGSTPTIQNTIWAPRSFLMANYAIANVKFPKTLDEWDPYTDKSTPWLLNSEGKQTNEDGSPDAIKVERAAARFDFRDASASRTGKDNTYDLLLHENSYNDQEEGSEENSGDLNIISIELTRMALVNESKNFYYLRRVADNSNLTNLALCGKEFQKFNPETSTFTNNFVVDYDWTVKNKDKGMSVDQEWDNFNFPLYKKEPINEGSKLYNYNRDGWYVSNISDVTSGENSDLWEGTHNGNTLNKAYKIWRYTTENTLPSAETQVTGQSTGIVFKGRIIKGKEWDEAFSRRYVSQALLDALDNVETNGPQGKAVHLYSFENRLFAGPEDIIAGAVQDGENSALYGAVNKVLKNWKLTSAESKEFSLNGNGEELTVTIANEIINKIGDYAEYTIKDLEDKEFYNLNEPVDTQISQFEAENYEDDGWGYYCFYFYWNRHNDNQKSGLMGNMEFATVRNNVYKLAVTGINRIGHPTKPGDDPDPEDPGKPDEPPTKYIKVQVDVLPWVVRVNDIEF